MITLDLIRNRKENNTNNNNRNINTNFGKIKVGMKQLDDAVLTLGEYKNINPRLSDKKEILRAIYNNDYETMREVSNFFYRVSGIYSRLCRYMAYLYKYDWMITPYVISQKYEEKSKVLIKKFQEALVYLDNFKIKDFFGEVALKVIRNGCYYGYIIEKKDQAYIQELPIKYCRTRFSINRKPVVEFNMKYFDDNFRDINQKLKILKLFPEEFKKGYILYKEGKLKSSSPTDKGWYVLDYTKTFKFNLNGEDFPAFISVIPAIIDLDMAQDLDRKKTQQKLLKILIQKMPIDKNGDLIFDIDEAQVLHNNAVNMLGRATGVDVLTTFADVDVADMSDRNTTTTVDDLSKIERTVYNEAGVSQMQFNTNGNLALEKSILNDESLMSNLLIQYEAFLDNLLEPFNKNKKELYFKSSILPTTIYNYKELSKLYKEQTQIGYSKMLPQIALGQSQSAILANAHFENEVLKLVELFIPPLMSSTMNTDILNKDGKTKDDSKVGRKEKEDDEKSDKTIANKESMN